MKSLALLGRGIEHVAPHRAVERHAEHVVAALDDDRVVVVLDLLFPLRRHRALHCGEDIVGRALEHGHVSGGLGQFGHHLHRSRARADHADALARIIEPFRPARGVEQRPLEAIEPRDRRDLGLRNHAHTADEVFAGKRFSGSGRDLPPALVRQIACLGDLGVELDVWHHVALVDDVAHVGLRFGAARIALGPLPFLQDLL